MYCGKQANEQDHCDERELYNEKRGQVIDMIEGIALSTLNRLSIKDLHKLYDAAKAGVLEDLLRRTLERKKRKSKQRKTRTRRPSRP
jgi:hypothetical protein